MPFAYRLQGALDLPALEHSLSEVVRRHDALRTGFIWRHGRPIARITPAVDIKSFLVVEDLAGRTRNSRTKTLLLAKAKLVAEREWLKPLDVKRPPLLRARLLRLGVKDHILLLLVHEIIIDGWSIKVFMEELAERYAAFASGARPQLADPPLQFSNFARWQRRWCTSDAASSQFAYWKACLHKAKPLLGEADAETELTSPIAQERLQISRNLSARIRALSHKQGATLFMTLLACFKTLLLLRTGRTTCALRPLWRTAHNRARSA